MARQNFGDPFTVQLNFSDTPPGNFSFDNSH
jgi:hypothetical protein